MGVHVMANRDETIKLSYMRAYTIHTLKYVYSMSHALQRRMRYLLLKMMGIVPNFRVV
jgi:hypothetical protein